MSLADELLDVHAEALAEIRGDAMRYVRAADGAAACLTLVRGETDHESRTPESVVVTVVVEDFLAPVAAFRREFGPRAVPEDDDRIYDPVRGRIYRVKPIPGEACHRTQQGGRMFRIHTKDDGPHE